MKSNPAPNTDAQKLTPPHLEFYCAVVTSEDSPSIAFLQKNKPLWPLLRE